MLKIRVVLKNIFICSLAVYTILSTRAFAQQKDDARIIEGAKREGKVVWYGAMNIPDRTALAKRFEEKYPFLKVEIFRLTTTRLLEKIQAETRAGVHNADVVQLSGYTTGLAKQLGLFQKYVSPESEGFPIGFRDPDGYWTDMYLNTYVITYNTRMVSSKDAPKSYESLLDPKWKGKMMLDRIAYEWFYGVLQILGEEKGLTFMRKLVAQDLSLRRGHENMLQMLAAGEFPVAVELHGPKVEEIKEKGAPVEWVRQRELPTSLHPLSIVAKAPHLNAAKLFVDFILSAEGQSLITSIQAGISSRKGIRSKPLALTEGIKLVPNDPAWIAANYRRMNKLYDEIFGLISQK